MRNYLIAAVALIGASAASASDFTGPWAELRGGFDSVQLKASANGASVSASRSGFVYGAAAGYDLAIGAKAIAGLQVGAYGTTAKVCEPFYGNDEACLKAGRDLEILARLGLKASADTLVYGLAGYANGRNSGTYVDFRNAANNESASENGNGFRIGAGVEQSFGTAFAKAEYRHTSYTKSDLGFGANAGFNRHQMLVGVGYRF
jgi:outer membrane immunogenic protein